MYCTRCYDCDVPAQRSNQSIITLFLNYYCYYRCVCRLPVGASAFFLTVSVWCTWPVCCVVRRTNEWEVEENDDDLNEEQDEGQKDEEEEEEKKADGTVRPWREEKKTRCIYNNILQILL